MCIRDRMIIGVHKGIIASKNPDLKAGTKEGTYPLEIITEMRLKKMHVPDIGTRHSEFYHSICG